MFFKLPLFFSTPDQPLLALRRVLYIIFSTTSPFTNGPISENRLNINMNPSQKSELK